MRGTTTRLATTWMTGLFLMSALVLATGCDKAADAATEDDELAVATAALEESQGGDQDGTISTLAFPEDETSGSATDPAAPAEPAAPVEPASAQERLDKLKGYIAKSLTCATAVNSPSGVGAKIAFGKNCVWKGRRWEGEVTITYTAANTGTVTLNGVNVDGTATITGAYTVTKKPGSMQVVGERTATFADRTVKTTLNADYAWDDESITVVSAARVRTIGVLVATMQTTDLHWLRSEVAPERGTVTWTNRNGKTITVVFSREADTGTLLATVTTPRGTKVLKSEDVLASKR
jgi:hypothetical protein